MRQFEWVVLQETGTLEEGAAGGPGWLTAATPGKVHRDTDTGVVAMHFAPARWLLVGPEQAAGAAMAALMATSTGVAVDVTGKYTAIPLRGETALPTLAAALNVAAVFAAGRECAAVLPYDCPAVLVRDEEGFTAWVASSHVEDFTAAVERAASVL